MKSVSDNKRRCWSVWRTGSEMMELHTQLVISHGEGATPRRPKLRCLNVVIDRDRDRDREEGGKRTMQLSDSGYVRYFQVQVELNWIN